MIARAKRAAFCRLVAERRACQFDLADAWERMAASTDPWCESTALMASIQAMEDRERELAYAMRMLAAEIALAESDVGPTILAAG